MIHIPKDELRQGRTNAVAQLKKERRRKKQWLAVGAVAMLFISFLLSVRVSPTIASYASKIPGLSVIVALVQENEGIQDAIDNKYYEELGILVQNEDATITLQGAIIDEYGVMLMYDFDYASRRSNHNNYNVEIYQGADLLQASFSYGTNDTRDGAVSHSSHLLEMTLDKPLDVTNPSFRVEFTMQDGAKQKIIIPFTLTKPIAQAKVVTPNKKITVEGQHLFISKIIRTPLRIQLEVKLDPMNTMQIIALDDVALELKNEAKRELIKNGLVGSGTLRDGTYKIYLQSNYFYDSDELTVHIGAIQAVPKGDDFIEVDFSSQKVLYKPDYVDWDIQVVESDIYINAPVKNNHGRQHLYPAEKEDGSPLESTGSSFTTEAIDGYNYHDYYEPYYGKATLWINYIDRPIAEDVKVRVKLEE